jgi:hypothetical protein
MVWGDAFIIWHSIPKSPRSEFTDYVLVEFIDQLQGNTYSPVPVLSSCHWGGSDAIFYI